MSMCMYVLYECSMYICVSIGLFLDLSACMCCVIGYFSLCVYVVVRMLIGYENSKIAYERFSCGETTKAHMNP